MRSRLAARRRGLQRPSLSSWTCFRAPLRSSRWIGPTSPASLELRNSMSGSLAAQIPSPERRKLPFFGDLHQEISRSWKQPFSSLLTNTAAADFTNLVGSVEQGYTAMTSWKSRPLLPSKPCRTTSALIGKSYIAAGQAGMALHTMAILQAYQADVLKKMDEGTGLTPEAVKELRRATDLALRATKHTACAVGRSMAFQWPQNAICGSI